MYENRVPACLAGVKAVRVHLYLVAGKTVVTCKIKHLQKTF